MNIIRIYGGMQMFKTITMEERLQKAEATNRALRSQLDQSVAQTTYVAMISGVDLPISETSQNVVGGGESDE